MDDNDNNIEEAKTEPKTPIKTEKNLSAKSSISISKNVFIILVCLILMGGSAFGAYYWRDSVAIDVESKKQEEIALLESRIMELTQKTENSNSEETELCENIQPSASTVENIVASVNTANTQPLEGYMAETVNVVLAASEAYGEQTISQAVSIITDFIGDPTSKTWDFNLPVSTLNSYMANYYGDYFVTIDTIGKSSDGKIISFSFDCNGDINQVFLANSEEIVIGN